MNRLPAFASIPDPLLATESSGTRSAPPLPSLRVVTFGAAGTRQSQSRASVETSRMLCFALDSDFCARL